MGETEKEHDERLHSALERLVHIGLHLIVEKCMFKQRQINYLGELITENGAYPDPEKVKAIAEMKAPSDKAELQRFIGMVTYVDMFIPNLSVISTPLRALIMKSADWEWNKEQKYAFENLKQLMTKTTVLQFYGDTKPIKVSTDACKSGIGVVILQQFDNDWMPIAYASRALSKSEQNYAMIEKKLPGVVFGCERFHSHVYGRSITVETDHNPIIAINNKPLSDAPPRLQRLMIRIQKYDLEMIYTPGKYLVIADTPQIAFLRWANVGSTLYTTMAHGWHTTLDQCSFDCWHMVG